MYLPISSDVTYKYIIYIYFEKKRKSRSMFSIYFDMFKLWVKLEIYHVLCYPVVL